MNKHPITLLTAAGLALSAVLPTADAAISLDRTRAVYVSDAKSISLNIANENKELPFLAQSWLENEQHQKITSPLVVLPPLQRVEPSERSVVRITKTPEADRLPQDRESVFYFNLREIPPKSTKTNVMQLALQTQICSTGRRPSSRPRGRCGRKSWCSVKAAAPSPSTTRRRFTSP